MSNSSDCSNLRTEYELGEEVMLDKDLTNCSIVKVVAQTSGKLFTTVESGGVQWDVMTNRLSR